MEQNEFEHGRDEWLVNNEDEKLGKPQSQQIHDV